MVPKKEPPAASCASDPLRSPSDLVPEDVWRRIQRDALRLPEGSPGRLIATEERPTLAEFAARLPIYERLIAASG